nr:putative ribonuclease H-like domain-containing protein [Tanacetum cinerariifolium]
DEEKNVTQPKIEKKIVRPNIVKKEFVKPRQQEKTARKTIKKVEHNRPKAIVNVVKGNIVNAVKASACWGNPQMDLQDKGVIVSGCSRHMTSNMSYRTDYEEIDRGYVAFGGNPKEGKITRKGKFNGKADEGFFIGYSLNSKAFRVFNSRTRILEENLHIWFSESTPNVVGTKASDNACQGRKETEPDDRFKPLSDDGKKVDEDPSKGIECYNQEKEDNVNNTNNVNTVSLIVNAAGTNEDNKLPFDPNMSALEDVSIFIFSNDDEDDDIVADVNNIDTTIQKFGFTEVKNASTLIETQKPLHKDEDGEEVDVHMYRSMIGSLMYLTSSRSDIMFAVCACARYQVNPKGSLLHAVKRIFRYLKGKAKKSVRLMMDKLFEMELKLILLLKVNAARQNLQLLVNVNAVEEQFWSTTVAKTINGEAQIHARVDDKKVIISEASIRRDLHFSDEGVDYLPNSIIFEQLASMGYEKVSQKLTFYKPFFSPQWKFQIHTILQCLTRKTIAWNELSSTVAFAIIYLATNQKFNFSKWVFDSMGRNLDNLSRKFLMYPRFIQVFLDKQIDGISNHERKYISPSHTKKFFGNMRRIGKGFTSRITPLFPTMVTHKLRKPKRKDTQVPQLSVPTKSVADKAVYKELDDSLLRAATTASSLEAAQDSVNINKTQSKATPNESSS